MKRFIELTNSAARTRQSCTPYLAGSVGLISTLMCSIAIGQTTIAPPTMGQETKGTPAIAELPTAVESPSSPTIESQDGAETTKKIGGSRIDSVLGNATIKESKRETGQVYLIELEHSSGSKQYIEETDSDGKIESTSNDIEETPNLPKWKIGSW